MDLALNNLQRLICHKTQQTKPNQSEISFSSFIRRGSVLSQENVQQCLFFSGGRFRALKMFY